MALIFALLVLVALMLAGVAMVRVINSSSQIAGNLAFRQDALMTSERATQLAIRGITSALSSNVNAMDQSNSGNGYYASAPLNVDVTGNALEGNNARVLINWDEDFCSSYANGSYASCSLTPARDALQINGNRASFIVFRLCSAAGAYTDENVHCATDNASFTGAPGVSQSGEQCQGAISYENSGNCYQTTVEHQPVVYRIVVRTLGPRNTVSYTETLVSL